MAKSEVQLRQTNSLPITWLTDGKLKLSIFLRNEPTTTTKASEALEYLFREKYSPADIKTAFPATAIPNRILKQKASADYLRCILAKGIDGVYRSVTPKYRNEAARKQFFKKLVEITEAVHLSDSNEKLNAAYDNPTDDDVMIWVTNELQRLLREKIDLDRDYHSRLNGARNEFKSFLRELEGITGQKWQDSERYRSSLAITSFFPSGIFENEDTWRWGTQWLGELGILNINPPILFFDVLRRGVLAREAAVLLSPHNLEIMEAAPRVLCEQSEYLAYRLFERKNDRELWSEARHGLRKQTRTFGHELLDFFHFYEMMVGESLYREVWARLREFGDIRLAVSDYYTIFNTLAARPTYPKFDQQDKNLLVLLSKRPDVKAGEAARVLRVSVPTAMKAIRDLSRRAGLRFNIIVDMQKIGLTENLVLINTAKQMDAIKVLSRFPFCRQVFRTYGSFDLFTVLDIPVEHVAFAREFLEAMTKAGTVTRWRLMELQGDLQAVNFDRYAVDQALWDLHWDSWGIGLRESLSRGSTNVSINSAREKRVPLDRLDLSILFNLHVDCRIPFSALGRSLDVSGAYIGKKVGRMLKENVFRYALWPLKIGAEDWGMVGLACSKPTAGIIAESMSNLPAWRGGIVTGDFEGIFAIVWCPNGEVRQLFKAIDDRIVRTGHAKPECMNSVGEWVVARWLPVDPDESTPWHLFSEDGRWVFDESRYLSLAKQVS